MPKYKPDVDNSQDILDSRDIIARIEELEGFRDDARTTAEEIIEANKLVPFEKSEDVQEIHGIGTAKDGSIYYTSVDYGEDEYDELCALLALAEEASGCSDWKHGETLIRDSYFEDYAQQFADDIGALKDTNSWPYTCIDWKQAASELQQDYTSVEFDGVTYWIRS